MTHFGSNKRISVFISIFLLAMFVSALFGNVAFAMGVTQKPLGTAPSSPGINQSSSAPTPAPASTPPPAYTAPAAPAAATGDTAAQTTASTKPDPATSNTGNSVLESLKSAVATTVLLGASAVLYVVHSILNLVLVYSAGLLNYTFQANINLNPADWPVVRTGWTISRDIANSLFILIVLWIAFTIIFGVEQYGGKKLFVRVLIVALVINFSLVAVTAVFGFSNAFATIFASQIPSDDVASIIANATKVQTVVRALSDDERAQIVANEKKASEKPTTSVKTTGAPSSSTKPPANQTQYHWGWKDTLMSSLGFPRADAANFGASLGVGCGVGALIAGPVGCVAGGITAAIVDVLAGWAINSAFEYALNASLSLAISNLFIFITIVAFLVASITLTIRMLMMIVLSIFAPLALLTQVVPVANLKSYWNMWTSALFRWAFFAPGFYFLFYLTLLLLQQFDLASSKTDTVAYMDLNRIFEIILALGMMIIAVKFAKKTGGAMADGVLAAGGKIWGYAMGIVSGGATAVAGTLARRQAPAIERGLEKIEGAGRITIPERIPIVGGKTITLGKVAAPATRRVAEFVQEQRDVVKERAEEYGKKPDLLTRGLRTASSDVDKAAYALALVRNKKPDEIAKAGFKMSDIMGMAEKNAGTDVVTEFAKLRPDLAPAAGTGTKYDRDKLETKMTADEISKIDWERVGEGKPPEEAKKIRADMMKGYIKNGSGESLAAISGSLLRQPAEVRKEMGGSLQGIMDDKQFWTDMEGQDEVRLRKYLQYMTTGQGRQTLGLPPTHLEDMAKRLGIMKKGKRGREEAFEEAEEAGYEVGEEAEFEEVAPSRTRGSVGDRGARESETLRALNTIAESLQRVSGQLEKEAGTRKQVSEAQRAASTAQGVAGQAQQAVGKTEESAGKAREEASEARQAAARAGERAGKAEEATTEAQEAATNILNRPAIPPVTPPPGTITPPTTPGATPPAGTPQTGAPPASPSAGPTPPSNPTPPKI